MDGNENENDKEVMSFKQDKPEKERRCAGLVKRIRVGEWLYPSTLGDQVLSTRLIEVHDFRQDAKAVKPEKASNRLESGNSVQKTDDIEDELVVELDDFDIGGDGNESISDEVEDFADFDIDSDFEDISISSAEFDDELAEFETVDLGIDDNENLASNDLSSLTSDVNHSSEGEEDTAGFDIDSDFEAVSISSAEPEEDIVEFDISADVSDESTSESELSSPLDETESGGEDDVTDIDTDPGFEDISIDFNNPPQEEAAELQEFDFSADISDETISENETSSVVDSTESGSVTDDFTDIDTDLGVEDVSIDFDNHQQETTELEEFDFSTDLSDQLVSENESSLFSEDDESKNVIEDFVGFDTDTSFDDISTNQNELEGGIESASFDVNADSNDPFIPESESSLSFEDIQSGDELDELSALFFDAELEDISSGVGQEEDTEFESPEADSSFYYIKGKEGKSQFIFKPSSNESLAGPNGELLTKGIPEGYCYLREYIPMVFNDNDFFPVPETAIKSFSEKGIGAHQALVENAKPIGQVVIENKDVHLINQEDVSRLIILDVVIGNQNRHLNNMLLSGGRVFGISHGLSMSSIATEVLKIETPDIEQYKGFFSEESIHFISELYDRFDNDIKSELQSLGFEELAIDACFGRIKLLHNLFETSKSVDVQFTLHEIAHIGKYLSKYALSTDGFALSNIEGLVRIKKELIDVMSKGSIQEKMLLIFQSKLPKGDVVYEKLENVLEVPVADAFYFWSYAFLPVLRCEIKNHSEV